jgi:transcriptional regulator with XRE-family HTH domain
MVMTPKQFKKIRKDAGYSNAEKIGKKLGLCTRYIEMRESGKKPIAPWLRLAMLAIKNKL